MDIKRTFFLLATSTSLLSAVSLYSSSTPDQLRQDRNREEQVLLDKNREEARVEQKRIDQELEDRRQDQKRLDDKLQQRRLDDARRDRRN